MDWQSWPTKCPCLDVNVWQMWASNLSVDMTVNEEIQFCHQVPTEQKDLIPESPKVKKSCTTAPGLHAADQNSSDLRLKAESKGVKMVKMVKMVKIHRQEWFCVFESEIGRSWKSTGSELDRWFWRSLSKNETSLPDPAEDPRCRMWNKTSPGLLCCQKPEIAWWLTLQPSLVPSNPQRESWNGWNMVKCFETSETDYSPCP